MLKYFVILNKITILKGNPNLISCPSRDQIPTVLSMYAYYPEAPFPTNDEILYCDSNTTSEQVENFLRIVFTSTGEKIYTLMNIQELTYENSTKIEQFWLSYKNKTSEYILVLVCCIEKQEQSILASVFSKNRIKPIKLDITDLEEYMFVKLVVPFDPNKSINLSSLDPNQSLVRTFLSQRSGNGKSTYIQHVIDAFEKKKNVNYEIIRIKSSKLSMDKEIEKLLKSKLRLEKEKKNNYPTVYHIDIAYEVFQNVDQFLFNLIFCSYLKHSNGLVWRRHPSNDMYLIEMTPPFFNLDLSRKLNNSNKLRNSNKLVSFHSMLNYLPSIEFRTPINYLYGIKNDPNNDNRLKDTLFARFYKEIKYQRIAYYLNLVRQIREAKIRNTPQRSNAMILNNPNGLVTYNDMSDDSLNARFEQTYSMKEDECLDMILNNSGLKDPNWHELSNFISFLNAQLEMAEKSTLLNQIKGLKSLCLQLIIIMANGNLF